MTLQDMEIPSAASANTLFRNHGRINSRYEATVTFGTDAGASELAVLTPCGMNASTGKWGAWVAPDPTVLTITLTGATGGTFTITVNGVTTSALAYNASAATVVAALLAIGVTATDTLGSSIHTITFTDLKFQSVLPTVSATMTGITGYTGTDAAVTVTPGTAAAQPLTPTSLLVNVGTASGGTWTITHSGGGGQTTGNIAHNATPAAVEAALLALSAPSVVANCTKTSATVYQIDFDSYTELVTLPNVSATLTSLTGGSGEVSSAQAGVALVPDPTEAVIEVGAATGGTFTITVNGNTTAGIAFDASAANVVTALGLIGVTATCVLASTEYTGTFGALADLLVLPIVTVSVAGLTGAGVSGAAVAGTATNGLHEIRGFVYPNIETLSATEDSLVVVSTDCEIHYAGITDAIGTTYETELKVALKDAMIQKNFNIQGLPGIG